MTGFFVVTRIDGSKLPLNPARIAWLEEAVGETGTLLYFSARHDDFLRVKEDLNFLLALFGGVPRHALEKGKKRRG